MLGRCCALITAVLLLFAAAAEAQAHRLDAQAFALPGKRVQVESWYSSGEPARGATVQIFGTQGDLLLEGKMNEAGIFAFTNPSAGELRVVILAGAGHRKEIHLAAEELAQTGPRPAGNVTPSPPANDSVQPIPLADRRGDAWLKDVILGISFLLALAAFVLSLRNARRLREADARTKKTAG